MIRATDTLLLLLQPVYGLLSRTTQMCRYWKGKPFWIVLKQSWWGCNGISWTICKSFAPLSRQTTIPSPHHSSFLWAGCFSCNPANSVKATWVMIQVSCYSSASIRLCAAPYWITKYWPSSMPVHEFLRSAPWGDAGHATCVAIHYACA